MAVEVCPKGMAGAPSALTRVLGVGYMVLLKAMIQRQQDAAGAAARQPPPATVTVSAELLATRFKVPACAILQLCMVSVLSVHIPALWSGRVNLCACVARLEKGVLYFGILQTLCLVWGDGLATVNTCAALSLAWYVWSNSHREWLPTPESMKVTLTVYFAVCVPLLWLISATPPEDTEITTVLLVTACLCDISLLCLECVLQAYARLWELLIVV